MESVNETIVMMIIGFNALFFKSFRLTLSPSPTMAAVKHHVVISVTAVIAVSENGITGPSM